MRTPVLVVLLSLIVFQGARAQAPMRLTLDEAIRLAVEHSPALRAARTQIDQGRAQETTAALRPNPVLQGDAQFLPLFHPGTFSADQLSNQSQFDAGVGYLFERGAKRGRRIEAARDETAVTEAQMDDLRRALVFGVAQQFIAAQLAASQQAFADEAVASFEQTVKVSEDRRKAGDISEGDLLRIRVQLLQFQTDARAARLARVQAIASLRQLIGYDAVPANIETAGDLGAPRPTDPIVDLEAAALAGRADVRAARRAVEAARSQLALARANAKPDVNLTALYSHQSGTSSISTFFSVPLPVFNRNQGEVARTESVVTQADLAERATEDGVRTDVRNAYEAVRSALDVLALYEGGYLDDALKARDITAFAYGQGAASLLEYLDAERSYRALQLAYRQALASHALAVEQLRQAAGTR